MAEYGRIHTDGSRSGGQPVLKPCPFCGGQAAIVEFQAAGGPWWMGECQEPSCDAAGPAFTTEAEAIAVYNTRQPTQNDALHEALATAPFIGRTESVSHFMERQNAWLKGPYLAAMQEQSK